MTSHKEGVLINFKTWVSGSGNHSGLSNKQVHVICYIQGTERGLKSKTAFIGIGNGWSRNGVGSDNIDVLADTSMTICEREHSVVVWGQKQQQEVDLLNLERTRRQTRCWQQMITSILLLVVGDIPRCIWYVPLTRVTRFSSPPKSLIVCPKLSQRRVTKWLTMIMWDV